MAEFNTPLPVVNQSVIRLILRVGYNAQAFRNVFYYLWQGTGLLLNVPAACASVANVLRLPIASALPQDAQYQGFLCEDMQLPSELPNEQSGAGGNSPGLVSSPAFASQVAVLFTRATAIRSKKGRGHIYFGPVPVSFSEAGSLSDAAIDAYNALQAKFMENIPSVEGSPLVPALATRKIDGATGSVEVRAASLNTFNWVAPFTDRSTRKIGRGI